MQNRSRLLRRKTKRFGNLAEPFMAVSTREQLRIFDTPHELCALGLRGQSKGSGERGPEPRTRIALMVEENQDLTVTARVDGMRDPGRGEHAGGGDPPPAVAGTNPQFTIDSQDEVHRVM